MLAQANVDQAKGSLEGPRQAFTIGANDQLFSAQEYRAARRGLPQRRAGAAVGRRHRRRGRRERQAGRLDERRPAVIVNIQRQPGANIIGVVDRIKRLLPQLRASLPSSVNVAVLTDRTMTIRASVDDVQFELMLTVALVVHGHVPVPAERLGHGHPSVAVPLSLIGTFGVMYLLGYSLNNLSLMALTISTGFVVDDAIVMIENIARYIEEGDSPLQAALKGSEEIGFTIVSFTVSLIAVLIPLLFMGDVVGRLFREFAVTLSVTILVSAVVSLTLTPMMCCAAARHRAGGKQGRFYELFGEFLQPRDRVLTAERLMRSAVPDNYPSNNRRHTGTDFVLVCDRAQGFFASAGLRHSFWESLKLRRIFPSTRCSSGNKSLASVILKDPAVESLSSFIGVDGTNATSEQRQNSDQP